MESKNAEYSVGDLVVGNFGWTTHTVCNKTQQVATSEGGVRKLDPAIYTSPSTALGVLGMPGYVC